MAVDISNVLHVLAHELRTPTGIAQGYVRLLLEDRLSEPSDRRRALEQAQKALTRITELTHESTALASFFDGERGPIETTIAAQQLLDRVAADAVLEPPVVVQASGRPLAGDVLTFNAGALVGALVTMTRVTARELRAKPCTLAACVSEPGTLDLFVGSDEQFAELAEGPDAPGAGPIALERGGVGLSLVHADLVLDAHGARRWTVDQAKTIVGIRFRLEEGTPP